MCIKIFGMLRLGLNCRVIQKLKLQRSVRCGNHEIHPRGRTYATKCLLFFCAIPE